MSGLLFTRTAALPLLAIAAHPRLICLLRLDENSGAMPLSFTTDSTVPVH